jgi:hypothetical protein
MSDSSVTLKPLSFKAQDAGITLRDALKEHRSHIPALVPVPEDPVDALDVLFAGHDVVHCLFGLGTTTAEEVRVDAYSVIATTLSLRRYLLYVSHPAVAKVIWETTTLATLPGIALSVLRIPAIWWRTRRMKRWDFDAWRGHLDRDLASIRSEYGIRVDGVA